jgi:hypothetical protein
MAEGARSALRGRPRGQAAAATFWENRLLEVAQGGAGNAWAIQWALRNRLRAAGGWHHDAQRLEHSGPNGAPVAIEASAGAVFDIGSMPFEDREALKGLSLREEAREQARLTAKTDRR